MIENKTVNVKNKDLTPIASFMILIISLFNLLIVGCTTIESKDSIGHLSYSPNGKKLLFFRQFEKSEKGTMINVLDITTGELSAYEPPLGETWSDAKYSYDGNKIVFITMPYVGEKYEMEKTQIAIIDIDGRNYRKLTNSKSFKIYPAFSRDGKRIIYCNAGAIRKSGATPAADYDFYEIDLNTGNEIRLTNFKLFITSAPYYFPDDERIIFSTYGYERQTRGRYEDEIYTFRKSQKKLDILFYSNKGLREPLVTADGTIYFITQAYKSDGSGDGDQIFKYSVDGKHKRISNIPWAETWQATVSPDGKWIAVAFKENARKITFYSTGDSVTKEIPLPVVPSKIINKEN